MPIDSRTHGIRLTHCALQTEKEGGVGVDDAAGFFANVFGGERFKDWVRPLSRLDPNLLDR